MKPYLHYTLLAQLEQAAPHLSVSNDEANLALVKALGIWSASHKAQQDSAGTVYWRAALSELLTLAAVPELAPKLGGSLYRNFCLVLKRQNDGYHVAWSQKQLDLLKQAFDLA